MQSCRPNTIAAARSTVDRAAFLLAPSLGAFPGNSPSEFKVTVVNKSKVKIDELIVDRCKHLYRKVCGQIDVGGECTIEEAEVLLTTIDSLRTAIEAAKYRAEHPRPEIGSEIEVYRFNHECREDFVTGTVISDDGDEIEVEVAPGVVVVANWEKDQELWVDWSDEDESD